MQTFEGPEQNKARAAAKKLEKVIGQHVGSGYGFPDKIEGNPGWHLIVWTDDENFQCPDFFDGFKVTKRSIPVAS